MHRMTTLAAAAALLAGAAAADDEIKGRITAIDPPAGRIEISGVAVDASGAKVRTLARIPARLSDLRIGNLVEAEGAFTGPGAFRARRVQRELGRDGEIEGTIERVDSNPTAVVIGGVAVAVPPEAVVIDPRHLLSARERLAPGARVSCSGTWTGPLAFTARTVRFTWER
ncbi:MAG: DUF5666 domain-containing protein [bacterium]|nr:DUF5666 domain-containing protein [bacterium]